MKNFLFFLLATLLLGASAYYTLHPAPSFIFAPTSPKSQSSSTPFSLTSTLPMPATESPTPTESISTESTAQTATNIDHATPNTTLDSLPPSSHTATRKLIASAHSSTLASLGDGRILSAYFAGSREGASDVKIYGNILSQNRWGEAFEILSRQRLMRDAKEYIAKLGNPVLYRLDDTLHLFIVGASIGGWATSKLYHYTASPKDLDFRFSQALHLSPFLNISTLARTQPLAIRFQEQRNAGQTGFILPLYHELATKYPLLLVLDSTGHITQIKKPNKIKGLLQPSITALSPTESLLAFRAHKSADSILYTQLCDNRLHCSPPQATNLKNQDNSLNLFTLGNQTYLLYNTPNENLTRGKLSIARLKSPTTFQWLTDIDATSTPKGEVSYPTAIITDGQIHITYTLDRRAIRHKALSTDYFGD